MRNILIYKCPADKSTILLGGRHRARVRSYSMNAYMNSAAVMDDRYFYVFRKMDDLSRVDPSMTWVFIDEHEDTIGSGWFYTFVPTPSDPGTQSWFQLPTSRHESAATLSFADGHVSTKKWVDPLTRKPVTRTRYIPSFAENADAAWLAERSTRAKSP